MKAEEIVSAITPLIKELAKEFAQISRRSRDFYDSDAAARAAAICLRKFGKVYCDSGSWVGIQLNNINTFIGAIEALREAGYRPSTINNGTVEIHVNVGGWRALRKLERKLKQLTRRIAKKLDYPVGLRATIIMTEDPARPCYTLTAIAYGPRDESLMLRRLIRLMAELGTDPATAWETADAGQTHPINSLLCPRPFTAYEFGLIDTCRVGGSTSLNNEAPEDYGICGLCSNTDESQAYPLSCEGIRRVYLSQVIPKYEYDWGCLNALRKVRKARIVNVTEGTNFIEAVAEVGGHEFIVRCGERRDDNFVEAGDKESLTVGIKTVIDAYFKTRASKDAGIDPRLVMEFKRRVERVKDPCEVIEMAWELEEL